MRFAARTPTCAPRRQENPRPLVARGAGRFLTDGRIEIESIIVERAIRPETITRKNWLRTEQTIGDREADGNWEQEMAAILKMV